MLNSWHASCLFVAVGFSHQIPYTHLFLPVLRQLFPLFICHPLTDSVWQMDHHFLYFFYIITICGGPLTVGK